MLYRVDEHAPHANRFPIMQIYTLDPLLDPRWNDLVASHPQASVFHHPGWLKALAGTYGFRPLAVTHTPPGQSLSNGVVFCEIRSCLTGSRLVSLPFSDHAEPLLSGEKEELQLGGWLQDEFTQAKLRYIEFRPLSGEFHPADKLRVSRSFWLHILDLSPSIERLFRNCHRSCIQRRIRHAERQRLSYSKGRSSELVDDFYKLMMMTRKRHRLLSQPRMWFQNLITCMGPALEIRIAYKDGEAIAAILTLRHRGTVVYKYGCSNERFHRVGGIPYLLWRLIEESKTEGADQIDFGRTDADNAGLIEFKDRLGASRKKISYLRYLPNKTTDWMHPSRLAGPRKLLASLPNPLFSGLGRLVYRHIG